MIVVKNLTKTYGSFVAVDDISFDIATGEIVGFLGPNGAGKTTTMRILSRFLEPTRGMITIDGMDVQKKDIEVRKKIGYLPENTPLYSDMTVREFLHFSASLHDIQRRDINRKLTDVASRCGIGDRLHQEIGKLSKGYKQRVGLANALISDPQILILDEPTSGLDPNQVMEMRQLIKAAAKDKTILLSSHILSEVEATCDRVIIIHRGKLVATGKTQDIRKQLGKKSVIRVLVEKNDFDVEALIRGVNGVSSVKSIYSKDEQLQTYEIETGDDSDVRKVLVQTLVKHDIGLLEICRTEATLEQVFAELTKK
ncbi:MAG: ATP-binding cassette domain-containing protein [Parcubacteria group bacterium]|nr:ATP-binding cassette domain-containing protein [Parcubacteria group bacterium]